MNEQLAIGEGRVAFVFLLLLAGCIGSGGSDVDAGTNGAAIALLRVLVTDDEFLPIEGAIVFLEGRTETQATGPNGTVVFRVPDEAAFVKAWAPSYYRNSESVQLFGNASANVHIVLDLRPPDLVLENTETEQGICFLGVWTVTQRIGGCLPPPECFTPCSAPNQVVTVSLPEAFRNATVRLGWEPSDNLAFTVRLDPPKPFANGANVLVLEGGNPIVFHLMRADLGTNVTLGQDRLVFVSDVPGDPANWGRLPAIINQPFLMEAWIYQHFHAPPNDPW